MRKTSEKLINWYDSNEIKYLLPTITWIIILAGLNLFCSTNILNSDMASEMVLARELADENKFITTEWFFSTEIRLIYIQLIAIPLFKLFSSWHIVRTLTNLIFYIILLGTYFYMMRPLNIKKKYIFLSSVLLFIPVSMDYLGIVHIGNSYMTHFVLQYFVAGLAIRLFNERKKGNIILFIIASFLCGLCGIRYFAILFAPLALLPFTFLYLKNRKTSQCMSCIKILGEPIVYISLTGFIMFLIGYEINANLLSRFFCFNTYDFLTTKVFDVSIISFIVDDLLALAGFNGYVSIWSAAGIASVLAVVIVIVFIAVCIRVIRKWDNWNDDVKYMILLFWTIVSVNMFLFIFIGGVYANRYYMPVLIFLVPVAAIYCSDFNSIKSDVLIPVLLIGMCFNGALQVYHAGIYDKNESIKEVSTFLVESDLDFGMATYWNGNVITELTDGKVQFVNLNEEIEADKLFCPYHWLMLKKLIYKKYWEEHVSEKIFLLLTQDEMDSGYNQICYEKGELAFENSQYYVWVFDKKYIMNQYGNRIFVE